VIIKDSVAQQLNSISSLDIAYRKRNIGMAFYDPYTAMVGSGYMMGMSGFPGMAVSIETQRDGRHTKSDV
jgi:hypothetical protein